MVAKQTATTHGTRRGGVATGEIPHADGSRGHAGACPGGLDEWHQGRTKSAEQTGRTLTLEVGTRNQLVSPATGQVDRKDLKPAEGVKASNEDEGNRKGVTSIEAHPAA